MYEGIENESPKSKRHKLQEPYYFCRVCSGTDNDSFWDEIYEYISNKYDLTKVKRIYVFKKGKFTWRNYFIEELHKLAHQMHIARMSEIQNMNQEIKENLYLLLIILQENYQ